MTARAYMPEDFQMVAEWAADRGSILTPHLMGNRGFIIEDNNGPCMVAMVYLMFEVPIAVVDNLISRPGLIGKQAQSAWRKLWRCITAYLQGLRHPDGHLLGYKVIRTYCNDRLTKFAKAEGWQIAQHSSRQILYALP